MHAHRRYGAAPSGAAALLVRWSVKILAPCKFAIPFRHETVRRWTHITDAAHLLDDSVPTPTRMVAGVCTTIGRLYNAYYNESWTTP